MAFIEVSIKTSPEFSEIFMAELAELNFEAFEETQDGLLAYIDEEQFNQNTLDEVIDRYKLLTTLEVSYQKIAKKNWNKEWEKNYSPIEVEDKCIVRASFHEPEKHFPYEIIITPKMSFGTGHHATTWQMLKLQMEIEHTGKSVLDVGSGTGILAIMAMKLGAKSIAATDIDDWCIENSKENFSLNEIESFDLRKGVISGQKFKDRFDIVIANINKNVLIDEIPYYVELLKPGGNLLLSGFYEHDEEDIKKTTFQNNLSHLKTVTKDKWAAMVLVK